MKEDIEFPKVEDIALAVVRETEEGEEVWNVYLVNLKPTPLANVIIASKGYGKKEGEVVKTSTLRHYFEEVGAKSAVKIEPIITDLFGLSNEYWVSFYENKVIFDKKYVFLAESIKESNFITVPIVDKKGVMIR